MSVDPSIIKLADGVKLLVGELAKQLRVSIDQSRSSHPEDNIQNNCRQLQLQIEISAAKTLSWYNLWFTRSDKTDDLFKALWGQAGHRTILQILQDLEKHGKVLSSAIEKLDAQLDAQIQKSKVKRTNSWKKLFQIFKSTTKWTVSAIFGDDVHEEVRKEVQTLAAYVDDLWAKSELHFRLLHVVPQGHDDSGVGHAVATRPASSALYRSVQSCDTGVDLDLNLLNPDQDVDVFADLFGWSDLKLSYHMRFEVPSQQRSHIDLVADLCEGLVSQDEHGLRASSSMILNPELEGFDSNFVLKCPGPSDKDELSFYIQIGADPASQVDYPLWLDAGGDVATLSLPECMDLGSPEARLFLAYRIVESSLFLLGTPWLSHLNSDAIRTSSITKHNPRYSLRISAASLKITPETHHSDVECDQVLRIGIILIEIALGHRTFINTPTDTSAKPMTEHLAAVEENMGASYRQACEFCLVQRDKKASAEKRDIDVASLTPEAAPKAAGTTTLFYNEVFMRLREMYTS